MCRSSVVLQLVENENVRGVVTMNEMYETKYFCNSSEVSLPVMLIVTDIIIISENKQIWSGGYLMAGMAGSRGGAPQTGHCGPHRRSHPGVLAPGCGVYPKAPRAGKQCVRPLQGWTIPQCHASCCVPH